MSVHTKPFDLCSAQNDDDTDSTKENYGRCHDEVEFLIAQKMKCRKVLIIRHGHHWCNCQSGWYGAVVWLT